MFSLIAEGFNLREVYSIYFKAMGVNRASHSKIFVSTFVFCLFVGYSVYCGWRVTGFALAGVSVLFLDIALGLLFVAFYNEKYNYNNVVKVLKNHKKQKVNVNNNKYVFIFVFLPLVILILSIPFVFG